MLGQIAIFGRRKQMAPVAPAGPGSPQCKAAGALHRHRMQRGQQRHSPRVKTVGCRGGAGAALADLPVFGSHGGDRILCYGDSNTAGYHSNGRAFQPYAQALAEGLMAHQGSPCEVTACGLSGFTTQEMLQEQANAVVRPPMGPAGKGLAYLLDAVDGRGPYGLVIIMTGTNDLGFYAPVPTIVQHVAQLHAVCHQRGVPTLIVAPTAHTAPQLQAPRRQLARQLEALAAQTPGVLGFVDVEDLVPRSARGVWEMDQLHLSPAGSTQLGHSLVPMVAAALAAATTMPEPAPGVAAKRSFHRSRTAPAGSPAAQAMAEEQMSPAMGEEADTPASLLAAAVSPSQAFQVGDEVQVFSNSTQSWCNGRVDDLRDGRVVVILTLPNGEVAKKELPVGHKDLRHPLMA